MAKSKSRGLKKSESSPVTRRAKAPPAAEPVEQVDPPIAVDREQAAEAAAIEDAQREEVSVLGEQQIKEYEGRGKK